ncbi:hypothetical protein [Teichococcus vastitatis]|jgi:hypothetical protein|uniref:Uncharacterized protein n=1 Tax=Teichococcus vastitatis TaxID=2307076 RepID=A0ABS9VZ44_9PROT|nr:hypothetical protein [Pseudoroseomonas vastitatis]MCI0752266.1 hypothetical protein [Pseudoroseomonas vastitatis]
MSDTTLSSLPHSLSEREPRPSFAKGLLFGIGFSLPIWGAIGLVVRRAFF